MKYRLDQMFEDCVVEEGDGLLRVWPHRVPLVALLIFLGVIHLIAVLFIVGGGFLALDPLLTGLGLATLPVEFAVTTGILVAVDRQQRAQPPFLEVTTHEGLIRQPRAGATFPLADLVAVTLRFDHRERNGRLRDHAELGLVVMAPDGATEWVAVVDSCWVERIEALGTRLARLVDRPLRVERSA